MTRVGRGFLFSWAVVTDGSRPLLAGFYQRSSSLFPFFSVNQNNFSWPPFSLFFCVPRPRLPDGFSCASVDGDLLVARPPSGQLSCIRCVRVVDQNDDTPGAFNHLVEEHRRLVRFPQFGDPNGSSSTVFSTSFILLHHTTRLPTQGGHGERICALCTATS